MHTTALISTLTSTLTFTLTSLLTILISRTSCFPASRSDIPNGWHVPNPCIPNQIWPGVGHQLVGGNGVNNVFGNDFQANGMMWTKDLCVKDSDGDGRSNGLELGDPNCTWSIGQQPMFTTGLTHPGVCEPVNSSHCLSLNNWFTCQTFSCPSFSDPATKSINLTMPYSLVPPDDQTLICVGLEVPSDQNYQFIGNLPIINNSQVYHHTLLYACTEPLAANQLNQGFVCSMSFLPCKRMISYWVVGMQGVCSGADYGSNFGMNGITQLLLLIHWDNPRRLTDQWDASGLQMFYTTKIRPNNAMITRVSQLYIDIPPYTELATVNSTCGSACTNSWPIPSVTIVEDFLHMHTIGEAGNSYLMSGNQVAATLFDFPVYDSYNVSINYYSSPIQFTSGDSMVVNCNYSSLYRNFTTIEGEDPNLYEMCLALVTFYPVIDNFDACGIWQDIDVCSLSSEVTFEGTPCDGNNFESLLGTFGSSCDATSCASSANCQELLQQMSETGCTKGEIFEWYQQYWIPDVSPSSSNALTNTALCLTMTPEIVSGAQGVVASVSIPAAISVWLVMKFF